MSYVSTPAGLQTVAVDGVTIEGDGTPADPLVAVGGGGGGGVLSAARFVVAGVPPFPVPTTGFIPTDTFGSVVFNTGTDFDFISGGVRIFNDGLYKITLQLTLYKPLNNARRLVQIKGGLTSVFGGDFVVSTFDSTDYQSNTEGYDTVNLEFLVQAVVNDTYFIKYEVTGTAYSLPEYQIADFEEVSYLNVERLA